MTATCLGCGDEFEPHSDSRGKYCSRACQQVHEYAVWEEEVERTGHFTPVIQVKNRHRRYLHGRQGGKCAICGRRTWLGKPISLVFDHINGQHDDWRVENCRLICNNCDAQQPTFKGANRGNGRKYRRSSSVGRAGLL